MPGQFSGPLSEADKLRVRAWLAEFERRVAAASASTGCACSLHWRAMVLTHPPRLQTAEALLEWTQVMHDLVNVRLGKRVWRPVHTPCTPPATKVLPAR